MSAMLDLDLPDFAPGSGESAGSGEFGLPAVQREPSDEFGPDLGLYDSDNADEPFATLPDAVGSQSSSSSAMYNVPPMADGLYESASNTNGTVLRQAPNATRTPVAPLSRSIVWAKMDESRSSRRMAARMRASSNMHDFGEDGDLPHAMVVAAPRTRSSAQPAHGASASTASIHTPNPASSSQSLAGIESEPTRGPGSSVSLSGVSSRPRRTSAKASARFLAAPITPSFPDSPVLQPAYTGASLGGISSGNAFLSGDDQPQRAPPAPATRRKTKGTEDNETRKAKNRAAATRSREKRRAELSEMREANRLLENKLRSRDADCCKLRDEVGALKSQVMLLTRLLESQLGAAGEAKGVSPPKETRRAVQEDVGGTPEPLDNREVAAAKTPTTFDACTTGMAVAHTRDPASNQPQLLLQKSLSCQSGAVSAGRRRSGPHHGPSLATMPAAFGGSASSSASRRHSGTMVSGRATNHLLKRGRDTDVGSDTDFGVAGSTVSYTGSAASVDGGASFSGSLEVDARADSRTYGTASPSGGASLSDSASPRLMAQTESLNRSAAVGTADSLSMLNPPASLHISASSSSSSSSSSAAAAAIGAVTSASSSATTPLPLGLLVPAALTSITSTSSSSSASSPVSPVAHAETQKEQKDSDLHSPAADMDEVSSAKRPRRVKGVKRALAAGLAMVAMLATLVTGPTETQQGMIQSAEQPHTSTSQHRQAAGTGMSILAVDDDSTAALTATPSPAAAAMPFAPVMDAPLHDSAPWSWASGKGPARRLLEEAERVGASKIWAGQVLYAWGAVDALATVAAVVLLFVTVYTLFVPDSCSNGYEDDDEDEVEDENGEASEASAATAAINRRKRHAGGRARKHSDSRSGCATRKGGSCDPLRVVVVD